MKVVCFDLDDTLYKEIDYLKSAYNEIVGYAINFCKVENSQIMQMAYDVMLDAYLKKENAFEKLNSFLGLSIPVIEYLQIYRMHSPNISLSAETEMVLNKFKESGFVLGLITDGRSVQQRNKIHMLKLERFFDNDNILISEEFGTEKPNYNNYLHFMKKFPHCSDFTYVGDNLKKDFVAPNFLGWKTYCLLDDGRNIHKQNFNIIPESAKPKYTITSISELINVVV